MVIEQKKVSCPPCLQREPASLANSIFGEKVLSEASLALGQSVFLTSHSGCRVSSGSAASLGSPLLVLVIQGATCRSFLSAWASCPFLPGPTHLPFVCQVAFRLSRLGVDGVGESLAFCKYPAQGLGIVKCSVNIYSVNG